MPETEIELRMLSALTSGAKFAFSSTEKQYLRGTLFGMNRARSPWTFRAEPMKWAAMLVSETTRQYYGRSDAVNRYMTSCFGFMRMLLEQHLPVDVITEADLENGIAAGYKVLILPNTACLSAAACAAIRQFVASGGGLVATGSASLYDERGAVLGDYALSDLFKASKADAPVNLECRVSVFSTVYNRNIQVLGKLLSPSTHLTSYVGEVFPASLLTGGATMASVCSDLSCAASYPLYINNANSGAGRVAFFPARIDAAYYQYPYPYQWVLLKDAVVWAASAPPTVTVVGPKSLQTAFFTQNGGKRIVVHLLNTTNTRGAHANPAGDVPARDEIAPLYDIEVWFSGTSPTSAKLQPENQTLQLVQQDGRTKVVVSELGLHSMVVADLP